ncbi:MAG: hypothetical protein ACLPWD_09855 [Methanobacterium sp.]
MFVMSVEDIIISRKRNHWKILVPVNVVEPLDILVQFVKFSDRKKLPMFDRTLNYYLIG